MVKSGTPSGKQLPDSKTVWIFTNQGTYIALLRFNRTIGCGRGLAPWSILNPGSAFCTDVRFPIEDDPCRGDEGQKARVDAIKKDFRDADIAIRVLPLPRRDAREFDRGLFYGDAVAAAPPPDPPVAGADDAAGPVDVEALLDNFAVGARKRRKYATLPLLLPGWRERGDRPGIMLDLYGVVQVRDKPQKVAVHQETNK